MENERLRMEKQTKPKAGKSQLPKIELRLSAGEKSQLQHAADLSELRLATWCKSVLMLAARGVMASQKAGGE